MDPAVFTGSDKLIRFDSMKEAHVALAFEGASWSSEFAFPLMVIQTLLGSWDRSSPAGNNIASRLARDIAENDAADSFMTFNTCYKVSPVFWHRIDFAYFVLYPCMRFLQTLTT